MEAHLISLVSFAGIASACGAVLLGARDLWIGREAAQTEVLRRLPRRNREAESPTLVGRFDHWFERTLYLSGWPLNSLAAMLLHVLVAVVLGAAVFLLTENTLLTATAALAGFAVVLLWMVVSQRRRVAKFSEQLPGALDLLARAVRAGESLDQAIDLVGRSSHEPLATEFRRCSGHLQMGLSLSNTLEGLTERFDLIDVRILANTLSTHRDIGGNLAETLERLAEVIRDRRAFRRQLKSVTGAGRFTALFIATLGPLLFGYMFIFQPEYGRKLLDDPLGRTLLTYAVISQVVGLLWVMRLLKSDY